MKPNPYDGWSKEALAAEYQRLEDVKNKAADRGAFWMVVMLVALLAAIALQIASRL